MRITSFARLEPEEGESEIKTFEVKVVGGQSCVYAQRGISTTTPFIPMLAACSGGNRMYDTRAFENTVINTETLFPNSRTLQLATPAEIARLNEKKIRQVISLSTLGRIIVESATNKQRVYDIIKSMFTFNTRIHAGNADEQSNNNTPLMASAFQRNTNHQFSLRSYGGVIGNYSLCRIDDNNIMHHHILPVILQENFYYQILHLIRYGSIDMSKVIILIDKELENSSFEVPGLRTFYIGRIKSIIQKTAAQAWYVPLSFIHEQCFVSKLTLPYDTIAEKRQVKTVIKDIFCDWFLSGGGAIAFNRLPPVKVKQEPLLPMVEGIDILAGKMTEEIVTAVSTEVMVERLVEMTTAVNTIRAEMMEGVGVPADTPGIHTVRAGWDDTY